MSHTARSTRLKYLGLDLPVPTDHPRRALVLALYGAAIFAASVLAFLLLWSLTERL